MFTIEQINHAHDRLGNAATLPEYVRVLNCIGVEHIHHICPTDTQSISVETGTLLRRQQYMRSLQLRT
jgi:hypothetical protein